MKSTTTQLLFLILAKILHLGIELGWTTFFCLPCSWAPPISYFTMFKSSRKIRCGQKGRIQRHLRKQVDPSILLIKGNVLKGPRKNSPLTPTRWRHWGGRASSRAVDAVDALMQALAYHFYNRNMHLEMFGLLDMRLQFLKCMTCVGICCTFSEAIQLQKITLNYKSNEKLYYGFFTTKHNLLMIWHNFSKPSPLPRPLLHPMLKLICPQVNVELECTNIVIDHSTWWKFLFFWETRVSDLRISAKSVSRLSGVLSS